MENFDFRVLNGHIIFFRFCGKNFNSENEVFENNAKVFQWAMSSTWK